MVRSCKLLSRAVISAAVVFPLSMGVVVRGQDAAPAVSAVTGVSPVDPALRKAADDFWHYSTIARYELAGAEVKKLVDADPLSVLKAFSAVAAERKQDLDPWVARWKGIEGLKGPAGELAAVLDKGRLALRADQAFIEDNIRRLIVNERAYTLAVGRLRQSGELAVPLMLSYLRSPERAEFHGAIRRALTDMGKSALSPLLASTQMKDTAVLATVVTILGDMGYEPAVPYLLRLASNPETGSSVRTAAAAALAKLGSVSPAPADAYLALGEKFYYDNSMITAELSQAPVAYVWNWSEGAGLTKKDVPPAIFNELMAMRSAEYALSLDQGNAAALSLWLAANYKREVELPEGAADSTRADGQPSGHYYGVAAGSRYLNDVLVRALKDKNSPVALKAIMSLQEIAGSTNLFTAGATTPLSDAMGFPDRVVRFEAAYAIASALPAQSFASSDRVVPILAEMVGQTGTPGIVVVASTEAEVSKLIEALKGQGFNVVGATTPEVAVNKSTMIPSVDAVVVTEDVGLAAVDSLLAIVGSSPRLGLAPKVIVTKTSQSPFASRAAADNLVNLVQSDDGSSLKAAIETARARGGSNPLSVEAATAGSLRSLALLEKLSVAKIPALSLEAAKPTLIAALDDARPEVIMKAASVLALAGGKDGQTAIFTRAMAAGTPDDLKVSLLNSLSQSAKTFGNELTTDEIVALDVVVGTAENLAVRSAAAETRGALNLPPEEAKSLILKQSNR